jgi:site-specific recombinase XerD
MRFMRTRYQNGCLTREERQSLAPGTKAKLRNIMSTIFNHAIRSEWIERNPICLVRQSAKRLRAPDVLTAEEIRALLSKLEPPYSWCSWLRSRGCGFLSC